MTNGGDHPPAAKKRLAKKAKAKNPRQTLKSKGMIPASLAHAKDR